MTFARPEAVIYVEKKPNDLKQVVEELLASDPDATEEEIEAEVARVNKEALDLCKSRGLPSFTLPFNDSEDDDDFYIEATLEYGTTDNGGLTYLEATLYNISYDIVRQFQTNAFVRLDAGYSTGGPGVRTIFFGNLQYVLPERSGGELIWRLVAATNPVALHNAKVSIGPKTDTIGNLIVNVLEQVGLGLNTADPYIFGRSDNDEPDALREQQVTVEDYQSEGTLIEVITDLTDTLNSLTDRKFLGYINNTDPFLFDFVDLAGTTEQRAIEFDLGNAGVLNAGPVPVQGAVDNPVVVGVRDCATINALSELTAISEFEMTTLFNPRLHLGIIVKFEGDVEGSGSFVVSQLTHHLGGQSWTSDFRGPFGSGDRFSYSGGDIGPISEE